MDAPIIGSGAPPAERRRRWRAISCIAHRRLWLSSLAPRCRRPAARANRRPAEQPQGVAALDELGVGPAFEAISVPIARLVGRCERGWTLVDIPYRDLQAARRQPLGAGRGARTRVPAPRRAPAFRLRCECHRHVDAAGPLEGLQRYSRGRLRTVRACQALSRALTPCFQRGGAGLWRDLLFAGARAMPGSRYLMHRSIAAPRRCVRQSWAANSPTLE